MNHFINIMSNTDLQDAIIQTNEMLKSCPRHSDRLAELTTHLRKLLNAQAARASLGIYDVFHTCGESTDAASRLYEAML